MYLHFVFNRPNFFLFSRPTEIHTQPRNYGLLANDVGFVRVTNDDQFQQAGPQDKSCLFEILCKERNREGFGASVAPPLVSGSSRDPFTDLRHTLEQINMSLPKRNGLKTTADTITVAANSKVFPSSNGAEPRRTRRNKTLDENHLVVASSSTDDERTMRLRTRNVLRSATSARCPSSGIEQEKKTTTAKVSINNNKSRILATTTAVAPGSSGTDEVKSSRSQKGDVSRNDNIRTTKTSRLRAAALGE